MESNRLPRFKRAPPTVPMHLTERDHAVIRLVHQHRFLRSPQIVSLAGGSAQQVLRRLQLLYHHGFLERPRVQLEYYHQGGSQHMVYGLGEIGASFLTQVLGTEVKPLHCEEKNGPLHRLIFEHDLLVSDIMVRIVLAYRQKESVRLVLGDELPGSVRDQRTFQWRVRVNDQVSLGIVPDRVFAVVPDTESPVQTPCLYFLEADQGNMPIVRSNLSITSFFRKLLAYQATWAQELHRSQFGFNRFRVLTVTTTAARVESLVEACSRLQSGHGLFLFLDLATLNKHENMLTLPWKTVRRGEITSITD